MAQTWHDLLFAHWPVDMNLIRPLVPETLLLDAFDGSAWIGVVPFWMSGVRPRGIPALPGLSQFPELNVRTYVTARGKPGVYFFSLDAANLVAVCTARALFRLPYFYARMKAVTNGAATDYSSRRYRSAAEFRANYGPTGEIQLRDVGSIEHWLTERYCLYTTWGRRLYRGEVHHEQWPLQDAGAEIEVNTMATAAGIELPDCPPLLHFARRLEVLIWPLHRVK
jgi:uncharacterized protein